MSKRQNSTQNGPQAKRQRLRPGFRFVCPVPADSQRSASSSSLFVTVSASSRRRGNLTAENRVITSTLESSTPSSDSVLQSPSDPQLTENSDLGLLHEEEAGQRPLPDTETVLKPKRKRFTKNAVRFISAILLNK